MTWVENLLGIIFGDENLLLNLYPTSAFSGTLKSAPADAVRWQHAIIRTDTWFEGKE
jgi:hypothetical protein